MAAFFSYQPKIIAALRDFFECSTGLSGPEHNVTMKSEIVEQTTNYVLWIITVLL